MWMVIHHYVDEKNPLFLGVIGFRLSGKESEQAAGWLVNYGLTMVHDAYTIFVRWIYTLTSSDLFARWINNVSLNYYTI